MAQEFTINSSAIETKINQLLPSQGGFGAGVDFSASTMVIPIIDLTEAATGSPLRQDLQTALSPTSVSAFSVSNATTTIINTTGYFRVFGALSGLQGSSSVNCNLTLFDGSTNKIILNGAIEVLNTGVGASNIIPFDFNVFLGAGDSLKAISGNTSLFLRGCTRQIADISGNLVNPT